MPSSLSRHACLLWASALLAPLAAQAQQDEAKRCVYTPLAKLPVSYRGPSLDITVQGSINGKPATLLVNTGTFQHVLTLTGAKRHGLRLQNSGFASGISGYSHTYSTRLDEFSIGPAGASRVTMPVLADHAMPPAFDAMIGTNYLMQGDLEVSLAQKRISMFRPANCDGRFLAYWDSKAVSIPFTVSASRGYNPEFNVTLNGATLTAVIDTSASASMVSLEAARRIGLKLDAPNVERIGDIAGIGAATSARWSAVFDSLEIGTEKISSPRLDVVEAGRLHVDMLLGADFLRAHRVLFAMSQNRLYFSYVGGDALSQRRKLEPWVLKEASGGNADAQMALARAYLAVQDEASRKEGQAWLERAAVNGSAEANTLVGHRLLQQGRPAEAAYRLRKALDAQPTGRHTALWLFAARMRNQQAELGRQELEAAFARDDDDWPAPVARFYLGKLSEEALLKEASPGAKSGRGRLCLAWSHIAERHGWEGDASRAEATRAQQRQECAAGGAP
jgi:predicted aspartyl protease